MLPNPSFERTLREKPRKVRSIQTLELKENLWKLN